MEQGAEAAEGGPRDGERVTAARPSGFAGRASARAARPVPAATVAPGVSNAGAEAWVIRHGSAGEPVRARAPPTLPAVDGAATAVPGGAPGRCPRARWIRAPVLPGPVARKAVGREVGVVFATGMAVLVVKCHAIRLSYTDQTICGGLIRRCGWVVSL
ncbi:hypothetical protein GCM10023235_13680 [Kitasatospora terrestris]|uniref:Uncharacterized protein n=1 Tax=Kitasatospora terrestris TaxID=258051 RepID=A0ABP9DJB7_9ACTN